MHFEPIREVFRPLFGAERRETTTRFLYAILISALSIDLLIIVLRVFNGATLSNSPTLRVLAGLAVVQLTLFWVVKRGYVLSATLLLVGLSWVAATYLAWSADGVHDVAIYIYLLVIFIAALLTNWRFSIALTLLSIISIWLLAFGEERGLRAAPMDSPFSMAGDLTGIFILFLLIVYLVMNTLRHSLDTVLQAEEKFRKIFNVSPVAIAIASLEEGRLMDANRAYWSLTGLDPEVSLGKTTVELGSWARLDDRQSFVKRLKEEKSIHDPAYRITSQTGEARITLAFYELIDFEGKPAVLAMFYDVTDQRRAQAALEASEQTYRNFVEQSMEGIWLLAFDEPIPVSRAPEEQVRLIYEKGYISECNDVLARMYGYASSADMRGMRLLDLQAGKELTDSNYRATLKLVREGYRSANRETIEQTRDGKTVHFLNNAVGVIEQGCLVGIWGTQLDITVLKETEAALRRSELRTRALLDAIPDMIFEFKRDGTILQFISSATNRPLLPPDQFLGKTIQEVLPVSVANQTLFAIERVLGSGHVHAFEYQLLQDGESKTFEARLTPLSADTVLAIVREVTLQKWILGEREKLINELERKNAELERFTYTASHDLKSPLITIKGFLGFLRDDAQSGNVERLESDIRRIGDAADKMERLLNDLLELSRVGRIANQPQSVDLNTMIPEILELLHGRIHARNIRVLVQSDLPKVYGDRPRLMEIWQNLIDNAAKFMGDQPTPHVEIGQAGTAVDGSPVFFVRDNGVGIDPKFHDRVFGLFDKLDPRSEGTGIGLAIVKRIVEVHGGSIWVESEPGQGATFFFTLARQET